MRFQRVDVFQKSFFNLRVTPVGFAAEHFTTSGLINISVEFFNANFAVHAFQAKRVVIGWFWYLSHGSKLTSQSAKSKIMFGKSYFLRRPHQCELSARLNLSKKTCCLSQSRR